MIRPMTIPEIRKALRHSAEVCCEQGRRWWWTLDIMPADGVYKAAEAWMPDEPSPDPKDGAHAANFLLLVAEAVE